MKQPKIKKVTIQVDPMQGAAMLMVKMAPEGYRFVSMKRKGSKAVGIYERIEKP